MVQSTLSYAKNELIMQTTKKGGGGGSNISFHRDNSFFQFWDKFHNHLNDMFADSGDDGKTTVCHISVHKTTLADRKVVPFLLCHTYMIARPSQDKDYKDLYKQQE